MAKSSGLGQGLLVAGVNLSTDISTVSVSGGPAVYEVTGIDKSAFERIGGRLDGKLDYVAYFDDAASRAHLTLRTLVTTDVQVLYYMASTIGASAAGIVAKQLDYPPTRAADGMLTFAVPNIANGSAVEWGELLTAGLRTDSAGTNGTGLDGAASSTTGWSAYLQVTALTGTNVIVTLEDSADNVSFAVFTASAFTSVTAVPGFQRIGGAVGSTVRRYVRAVTSGTFSSATFAVMLCRHPIGATA